ncbi:glutamyl-tRNA reductase [Flectobacillus sp. BAB-3569]|uniref:glutamyl-tRNA reductase n=1 Tax=Flectobacillus sp. BAB-3569 TaxID=1509483 RepID=UPI000BA2BD41|nr:glutamyl-tRNA reductase [Flectobacillus sp. BAB-3569]PAC33436.1 glutamyl-tRNA reductase [Flectobacillus sp. BAB-3569]
MQNQFKSISLSYKSAPLAVREQVALNEDEIKNFSLRIRDMFDIQEAILVSTCNRTEVYYVSEENRNTDIIKLLLLDKGIATTDEYFAYFQQYNAQADAVQHLFEVATGLHSQVVGDLQIPNQVKQSYQIAADLNMAGPFLHRLMHTIFFANKRVAQETAFRDGAASTSYAAVALTEEMTQNITLPKVLILGLGEIGIDVCKNMADKEFAEITVMNRTRAKAEAIAEGHNFRIADFVDMEEEIKRADVVISSVMIDKPLITKEMIQSMEILTFKYFIDLSVPRSVEENLEEIPGVLVYNIDTLRQRADEALQTRLNSIPQVQRIISEATAGFEDWSKEMVVSPTINKLKNALEQIRKEELARHLKNLSPEESEKLDKITMGIVQKIIKLPVLQLKAACKRGEADQLVDVINEIFDLEKQNESSYSH